jgi:hypothetical protein
MKTVKVMLLVMLIATVASVVYAHEGYHGCTPGYWKNHPESWVGFSPDDLFDDVFDRVIIIGAGGQNTITDPTLMEALNATGGGVSALARHAVAGILNASHPDIHYPRTVDTIIYYVTFGGLDWGEPWITLRKDRLDEWNNLGCPENGTLVNGTTFALGNVDEAFSFDGVDDVVWAAGTDKAIKIEVTGTTLVTPREQEPLRDWADDDGIWHVRGAVADYEFLGDLTGDGIGVVNINLHSITGNGEESGCSILELTLGDVSGTFEGHFSVKYTGWVGIGSGVYHGTGGFAGMKLMEDFTIDLTTGESYTVSFEGIILDLHGNLLPLTSTE